MSMDRRDFLKYSGALTALPLIGCGGGSSTGSVEETTSTPVSNSLFIPSLLTGTQFDLTLQTGSKQFIAGQSTQTYGINGDYLGPALKVRKGDVVTLNVTNKLPESSTLHWHGMHVPGNMDGGPHQLIQENEVWQAQYSINQQAGTNWFHPHQEGVTGRQVYWGLAGLMIVEDEVTDQLDLPNTWGEDDIPLIIQDRRFNDDGSFAYLDTQQDITMGMQGDNYLVNGTLDAVLDVANKAIRFRLLNASNARFYQLQFSDNRNFQQIATDSGLRETSAAMNSLILSPAERTEIVVDFSADLGQTLSLLDVNNNNKTLLTININQIATTTTTIPTQLTSLNIPDANSAVRTRSFTLGMDGNNTFTINGLSMDMARIDQTVPLNAIEIWEVTNTMGMAHNFHIHATHFYLLERNGSAANIALYEQGYKDVVRLDPFDSVKFVVQMTDYTTDASAPYMFHCHILEHEDNGMMGQFIVS